MYPDMVAMYPHHPTYAKCVGFAKILDGVDNTASAASMFGVKAAIKSDTKHIMKSWANIIRYMCGDVFCMWWWVSLVHSRMLCDDAPVYSHYCPLTQH